MRHTAIIPLILLLLASCRGEQVTIAPGEEARRDSLALHVAVMPVMDCLPLYYAQRTGLFESHGLDVRLMAYPSQMDADTALLHGHAHMAYTDLPRVLEMQGDSLPLRVVAALPGRMSLMTAKKKRLRNLRHLDERMIALDRLSTADYWSDEVMQQAGLERTAIYRPQINDVQLRWSMLREQLVDGAFLPEPYATLAERLSHKRLYDTPDSAAALACLATRRTTLDDPHRRRQISLLRRLYDQAADMLAAGEADADTLRTIWTTDYDIPPQMADSLPLPQPTRTHEPQAADADRAYRWLLARERRIRRTARDSLFLNLPPDDEQPTTKH